MNPSFKAVCIASLFVTAEYLNAGAGFGAASSISVMLGR
jgi:hypothetical protein